MDERKTSIFENPWNTLLEPAYTELRELIIKLISCNEETPLFRTLFNQLQDISRSSLFGIITLCDGNAALRIEGRFGCTRPDKLSKCQLIFEKVAKEDIPVEQTIINGAEIEEDLNEILIQPLTLKEDNGKIPTIGVLILYTKGNEKIPVIVAGLIDYLSKILAAKLNNM